MKATTEERQMTLVWAVLALCVVATSAGCNGKILGGSITRTTEEEFLPATQPTTAPAQLVRRTETIHVQQPQNPVDAATIRIISTPEAKTVDVATGGSSATPTDQALGQLRVLTWVGIALCIGGVALLVLKSRLPLIPAPAGFWALGLGVVFIATPILLDRYSHLVMIGIGVAAVGGAVYLGFKLNWFKRETGPEVQAKLKAKGQADAAGALAFVNTGGDRTRAKLAQGK
jgi:hypothetical protein